MKFLAGDTTSISIQGQQFNAKNGYFEVPDHFETYARGAGLKPAPVDEKAEAPKAPAAPKPVASEF